ncbi:MAG: type II toxin-antitoxin system HigB family toxin [Victivallales bacterium]
MILLGKETLEKFKKKHADARKQTDVWIFEVEHARWKSPNDVKVMYPKACIISKIKAVFDIKGNNYRFCVITDYDKSVFLVKYALTHEEYNKIAF